MKVAYLASLYPAQSHTFIEREISALRKEGVEVIPFSVRRARSGDILGEAAKADAAMTRWLLPPPIADMVLALSWAAVTRPATLTRMFKEAVVPAAGAKQKLKWLAYALEAVLLARWLAQEGVAHLHCHFGNAGSNTAMLAAQLAELPLSITFHGIDLDEPVPYRHADKLRQCAFAVCISDYGRKTLLANTSKLLADKVHVIRCGYEPPAEEAVQPRPHAGQILCVARLSPEKGHGVLLEALAMLRSREVPFHCTLVGGGPTEAGVRAQIAQLGLQELVTLTGALPQSEVAQHYQECDVVVLASFGEGIPVVLLEALAHKRPVVATSVGGIPELVRDGVTGRLAPPRNAEALADAMADVLLHPDHAEAMGAAGRQLVAQEYNTRVSALKLKSLFTGGRGETP